MSKWTIKKIELIIKEIHGDMIILVDEQVYSGVDSKLLFEDKECGRWLARPRCIMKGQGHPKKRGIKAAQKTKLSVEHIKLKLLELYGDRITILDGQEYINLKQNLIFEDKEFGQWSAATASVLADRSHHPERTRCKVGANRKLTVEEISKRMTEHHGENIKFKNPELPYIDINQKVTFIDNVYGEFTTTIRSVLRGHGHRKRGRILAQDTCFKNFGVQYPTRSEEVKKRIKATCVEKYGIDHPFKNKDIVNKVKNTNIEKYGFEFAAQNSEIALKSARSSNHITDIPHWKTGELIPCHASYEVKTVQYFNKNQIDFKAQSRVFKMPNGKTYRPDFYLLQENKWIEVKGYMRKDAQEKWDWFHETYPNSELWDKTKLKSLGIL